MPMILNSTTGRKTGVMFIAMLLLSSLALVAPIQRVSASTTILSAPSIVVIVGSSFAAPITVTNVAGLNAFDITLTFDETQISYQSTAVAAGWFVAKVSRLPGFIRFLAFTLSPVTDTGAGTALLTHTFKLNLGGKQTLHIASTSGLALVGGIPQPYTAVDGSVKSTFKATVYLADVKPATTQVDFTAGQNSMDLLATIQNFGSSDVKNCYVAYRLLSLSGTVFGESSAFVTVPKNGNAKVTFTFAVDPVPTTFVGHAGLICGGFINSGGVLMDVRQLNHPFDVIT